MCECGGIGRRVGLKIQFRFRSVGSIPTIRTTYIKVEGCQSWSNGPVLKTGEVHASEGSNPLPSATFIYKLIIFFLILNDLSNIGAIAKLVMPRIANPVCVGSSPTSSSIS
jgi:hypothetical protein